MSENDKEDQKQESGRIIIDEIGKTCEDHNLGIALFLSIDPKTGDAIMWYKGQELTVGKLAAAFVKLMKNEILKDLEV